MVYRIVENALKKAKKPIKYKFPKVDPDIKDFLRKEFETSLYEEKERVGFLLLDLEKNTFIEKIPDEILDKKGYILDRSKTEIQLKYELIKGISRVNQINEKFKFIPYHTHPYSRKIKEKSEGEENKNFISPEDAAKKYEQDFSVLRELSAPYMIIIDPDVVRNDKIYIIGLGISDFDSKLH
ncbi:MAG: hypothetical protein J7J93_01020 [Candidatus Aenigmarchaeota archaeon]|nr:hypothetical protein [Candidatus Aenigmarchaeota archaeon]